MKMNDLQLKALMAAIIIAGDWANPANYEKEHTFADVDQALAIAEMILDKI